MTKDNTQLTNPPPFPHSNVKPPGAGPGRPRALDEIKRREVCALVSAGCGIEGAASYVGCATSTVRREALRNPDFNEALRRAHLAAELNPLNAMRQASATHWRAAAWLLERTNPQRFGKQNPRLLKPEQFQLYVEFLGKAVNEEINDVDLKLRIARRLREICDQVDRESWAANRSPLIGRSTHKPADKPKSRRH